MKNVGMFLRLIVVALAAVSGLLQPSSARGETYPQATLEILRDLKFDPSILNGTDQELIVPPDWIEKAKKEGTLRITGSWDPAPFQSFVRPFKARYPFIKVNYTRGSLETRALNPLMAFQQGRYIADVVTGIGASMYRYEQSNALQDLRDIPNAKNVLEGMKPKDGQWIGIRIRYWCMAYNTNAVNKADLPKTWDDLLTNPRWRGGRIGLVNLSDLWMLPLWGSKGKEWATDYIYKFFSVLRPQSRREGANALLSLVMAGEIDASIPAGDHYVAQDIEKGAPIGWHCPEPVPSAVSELGILRGGPNLHTAFLFTNWLLSKEGQVAQFHTDRSPPIHKDLQIKEFLSFPDEIVGKKIAYKDPALNDEYEEMLKAWNSVWAK